MQRMFLTCLFALSLCGAALAAEMTGIVTDAKCKHTDTSEASKKCAQACIKGGVPAVFVDTAHHNKVYKIANPDKVMDHIGDKVTLDATVDGDTLTVASVKMAK